MEKNTIAFVIPLDITPSQIVEIMNTRLLWLSSIYCIITLSVQAQHNYPSTPPEVSPMAMKPEMTEIWEPEVPVITPAKILGDAPLRCHHLI